MDIARYLVQFGHGDHLQRFVRSRVFLRTNRQTADFGNVVQTGQRSTGIAVLYCDGSFDFFNNTKSRNITDIFCIFCVRTNNKITFYDCNARFNKSSYF